MTRAGGIALSLLAAPLNVHLLQALEQGPLPLLELRQATGSPPQSTMRLYARTLTELGVIKKQRQPSFPGSIEYEITPAGEDLLRVAKVLETWLGIGPNGEIALGTTVSKSVTKALVEGWSTNIVRALAARPLSLTELNKVIPKVSYPSLERRLDSLRLAQLVEPQPSERRGTPYGATDWLRRAVVPVASAAAWERRYRPGDAQPIGRLDVEAAFLLAIALLEMPPGFSGGCRLAVEVQGGTEPVFAGALVSFEAGKVAACSSRLDGAAESWASGSPDAWLRRMARADENGLELGGEVWVADAVLNALSVKAALPTPLNSGSA